MKFGAPLSLIFMAMAGGCQAVPIDDLVGAVPLAQDAGLTDAKPERLELACANPVMAVPSHLVVVPGGASSMGCAMSDGSCQADERPAHVVSLPEFQIDATEVTQAQYYACVAAGKCLSPTCDWTPCGADGDHPVFCIAHSDAATYCAFAGERLPSEAEWERAARGTDGRIFPWGNQAPDCAHANDVNCGQATLAVGSMTEGASPYGLFDMAGNAEEWVADVYDPAYYAASPTLTPTGPSSGPTNVVRGGSFRDSTPEQRATARRAYDPDSVRDTLGFRCAKSASAMTTPSAT